MHATADSKSPDKYTINKNLVVNLNDSVIKPVKRENSNTTNATHITGITASTAGTHNTKNGAFYNTQYKNGKGFFQASNANNSNINDAASAEQSVNNSSHHGRPIATSGTDGVHPKTGGRFRSI